MTTSVAATQSATSGTSALSPGSALAQLGANFNQFLQLLLTQLQNQDPTAPTDTNQFTTELVQFTGVQEQANTNSSLSQLISLQQASQVLDSASLVGKQVTVSADRIALQNGRGELVFNGQAGEPIAITVTDGAGTALRTATFDAASDTNDWVWDGKDSRGNTLPDGAYHVSVQSPGTKGTATAVSFDVVGTATGASVSGTKTQLRIGALTVDLSALKSIAAS